jgi:hypothetical protein
MIVAKKDKQDESSSGGGNAEMNGHHSNGKNNNDDANEEEELRRLFEASGGLKRKKKRKTGSAAATANGKRNSHHQSYGGGNHQRTNIYITKNPYAVLKCVNDGLAFPQDTETEVAMTVLSLVTSNGNGAAAANGTEESTAPPPEEEDQLPPAPPPLPSPPPPAAEPIAEESAALAVTTLVFPSRDAGTLEKRAFLLELGKGANNNSSIDYNRAVEIARAIDQRADVKALHSELRQLMQQSQTIVLSSPSSSESLSMRGSPVTEPAVDNHRTPEPLQPPPTANGSNKKRSRRGSANGHANGLLQYAKQHQQQQQQQQDAASHKKHGNMRNHRAKATVAAAAAEAPPVPAAAAAAAAAAAISSASIDPYQVDNVNGNYRLGMIIGAVETKNAARVLAAMWGLKSRGSIPRGALGELLAEKFGLDLWADLTVIFEDLSLQYHELKQTKHGELWMVERERVEMVDQILATEKR